MTCKLLNSDHELKQLVLVPLLDQINTTIRKRMPNIIQKVEMALKAELWNSSEIQELSSSGKLAAILGVPKGEEWTRTAAIVDKVVSQTKIVLNDFRYVSGQLRGDLIVNILPVDLRELLSIPQATLDAKDWNFPFLKWLLTAGDKMIVNGYGTLVIPSKGFGRSESAIQIKSGHSSLVFRVPPQWSGVSHDNLLTRAISSDSFKEQLIQILYSFIL